jgi:hypothetical protein
MSTSVLVGNSWESFATMPAELARQLAAKGTRWIRVFVFWPLCNPKQGQFDWNKTDADFAAIRAAGMMIYASVYWAPAWASDGQPAYMPYTDGCWAWNTSHAEDGIRFADEREYCTKPPHISDAAMFEFGAKFAERYAAVVTHYGAGNEPGVRGYWPPIREEDGWPDLDRFAHEYVDPFTRGVRSVKPDALFVGPEADSHGLVEVLLRIEAEEQQSWFDVISMHPYGSSPADTFRRIDEDFLPAMAEHRGEREVWITENGYDENSPTFRQQVAEFMSGLTTRKVITRTSFHSFSGWFKPGTVRAPDGLPVNPSAGYQPNDTYFDMQKLAIKSGGRRRPAVIV